MSDLALTAANVRLVSGPTEVVKAGEVLANGKVVALGTDKRLMLCDSNSATPALRKPYGVVLSGGLAADQPAIIAKPGAIVTIGGTVAAGEPYFTSPTAGGIAPYADVATGHYTGMVGIGQNTTDLLLHLAYGGVAHG